MKNYNLKDTPIKMNNKIFSYLIFTLILILNISNTYSIERLIYPPDVFFGKSTKDDKLIVREFEINNLNKIQIKFDRYSILNVDGKRSQIFTLDPIIKFPILLNPNTNNRFRIGAEPQKALIGRNFAKLIFYSNSFQDSIEINLILNITKDSIIIAAPKFSYSIGDTFDLPILIKGSNIPIEVNSLEIIFKFNHTVITPINKRERGTINNSEMTIIRKIDITPNLRLKQTDTLINIKMLALLGNSTYSDIEFSNVNWYFNNIPNYRIPTIIENGIFETKNIFYDDGVPRLVTFNNFILNTYYLTENLININYTIKNKEFHPQISLFDLNGVKIPLILLEEKDINDINNYLNVSLVYKFDDNYNPTYSKNNLFFLSFIQNDLIITKKILNFKN